MKNRIGISLLVIMLLLSNVVAFANNEPELTKQDIYMTMDFITISKSNVENDIKQLEEKLKNANEEEKNQIKEEIEEKKENLKDIIEKLTKLENDLDRLNLTEKSDNLEELVNEDKYQEEDENTHKYEDMHEDIYKDMNNHRPNKDNKINEQLDSSKNVIEKLVLRERILIRKKARLENEISQAETMKEKEELQIKLSNTIKELEKLDKEIHERIVSRNSENFYTDEHSFNEIKHEELLIKAKEIEKNIENLKIALENAIGDEAKEDISEALEESIERYNEVNEELLELEKEDTEEENINEDEEYKYDFDSSEFSYEEQFSDLAQELNDYRTRINVAINNGDKLLVKELDKQMKETSKKYYALERMMKKGINKEIVDARKTLKDLLKNKEQIEVKREIINRIRKKRTEIIKEFKKEELDKFKESREKLKEILKNNERIMDIDSVISDNKRFNFDTPPVIKGGRTIVPIRAISEAFGANVGWNAETQTVRIMKGDIVIELPLGKDIAIVNGEEFKLEAKAELINSRTYVPLRFVSETLGLNVDWEQETETIIINE